ncbi:DUF6959 family protein [Streptomyces acidicola]|uniref:Uncharacterized protein n=1 Tax=Streptomyces acidicola TaxID=2596892 RepID=A0A5N8X3P1_9ACTN|nr:hypothetical protein [Streptomyces acidicola]MPY53085.1 hypothetical protein [Streptomyces acidicola]
MSESRSSAAVLAVSGNYSVIQLEGRRYPAAALQGDSLKSLHEVVEELSENLRSGDLDDAKFALEEIQTVVSSLKGVYEEALAGAGITLPYVD